MQITIMSDNSSRKINEYIRRFADEKIVAAQAYDTNYVRLWQNIGEYLLAGGKRIRPYLIILTYQAYGGRDLERIIPIAGAWELLHASLLVHDDIIDRDDVRHGVLNISGKYKQYYGSGNDKEHLAYGAALLAGDLLLSGAHESIARADISSDKKNEIQKLLSQALFGVAGGELLDTEAVLEKLDSVDALKIAQYKTAEYSCEYPIICGAVLADVGGAEQRKLKDMAMSLGIGYQLVDDLLGVFGKQDVTGKSNTGDIREKKRTLLIQRTYETLDQKDKLKLEGMYDQEDVLGEDEITYVKELIQQSGAKEKIEQEIDLHRQGALDKIDQLEVSGDYKEKYQKITEMLLSRSS